MRLDERYSTTLPGRWTPLLCLTAECALRNCPLMLLTPAAHGASICVVKPMRARLVSLSQCPKEGASVSRRIFVPKDRLPLELASLKSTPGVLECVILSTCLRFEIYAVVQASSSSLEPIEQYMRCSHAPSGLATLDAIMFREGEEAVRHLFSVSCGLDSRIVGEKQIVGQIKEAYDAALKLGCTGPVLNRLFQRCLHVSKKVRSLTGIDVGICSAASLAVRLLMDSHGSLGDRKVLILGAGQMGKLLGLHLSAKGCKDISFCSRSSERAKAVAEQCSAEHVPFERLLPALLESDVLVTATGAPHEIIGYGDMKRVMGRRGGRELCILDLADPPDVDRRVSGIDGVRYYPISCVDELAAEARNSRLAAARKARLLVDEAAVDFNLSKVMGMPCASCMG